MTLSQPNKHQVNSITINITNTHQGRYKVVRSISCKVAQVPGRQRVAMVVLVAAAATTLLLALVAGNLSVAQASKVEQQQPPAAGGEQQKATEGEKKELPKILDFANFKKVFKKRYTGGWREEFARCKLFLSRALQTVLSAMRYQAGYESYYLAVNEMSDATPEERDRMKNKQLEELVRQQKWADLPKSAPSNTTSKSHVEFYIKDTRPETLMAELAQHSGEPLAEGLRQLSSRGRSKRSLANERLARARRRRLKRALTMDQLIRVPPTTSETSQLPPLTRKKIRKRVKSNNPDYAGQIEPMTMGLADQQEPVNFIQINSAPTASFGEFLATMGQGAAAANGQTYSPAVHQSDGLPDEVFTDLRHTNCFLTPRGQGNCGCCYAFSMVAIVEFLHCIKTGELVAFSEQYMIDCGRGYIPGLNGCSGAGPIESGQFVHNFGMELRANYPYWTRENLCPYAPGVDLKTTGYIRTEIGNAVAIDEQLWPEYLKYGPMWVGIITSGDDFNQYAAGVHQPACAPEHGLHAMVLIGHGREDGLEYWLFRNSYGPGWGEMGYYKMARSAPCIVTPGFMYGTVDGRQFTMNLERNQANDGQFVSLNYARTMVDPQG